MTKILFVDDEPNILSGLRRMLHSNRNEWQMTFVTSGPEALEAIGHGFFDIIVSDLRMPGMDGIHLLQEVRRISPETVRIALSGYADRDATLRAATQIHQFLAKPCEPDIIKTTLHRAITLGNLLTDQRIKRLVSQMGSLPSLHTLFDEVVKEIEAPNSSLSDIGDKIAQDAGMSTKVLQLVNSSLFGVRRVVSSPSHAATLLGLDTIRTLVLSVRLFQELDRGDKNDTTLSGIWDHCVAVARLAKRIALAEAAHEEIAERAFLAGLLHDVGKLIFATNFHVKFASVMRLSKDNPRITSNLEQKIIGATHGEVGAYLMGLWGFSDEIIEAIALHHLPNNTATNEFSALTAVHAANALNMCAAQTELPASDFLDLDYLTRVGKIERVPLWEGMCQEIEKEDKP